MTLRALVQIMQVVVLGDEERDAPVMWGAKEV